MNRKIFKKLLMFLLLISFSVVVIPSVAISEGGGKSDNLALTHKVNTTGLSSFNKWWADKYNDQRVVFSLCVTAVMLCMGIVIGFGTDLILKMFGFKTTKIVHNE